MLGNRIIVTGSTGSGKSTLAVILADRIGAPFVEVDALNWEPNWTPAPEEVFRERLRVATAGDRWVISGNYFEVSRPIAWPHAQTVVFLDFPLRLILPRLVRRSWRRWRTQELLWGTNVERFWTHLTSRNSLLLWACKSSPKLRRRWVDVATDPELDHVRFVRLRSPREVERWLEGVAPVRGSAKP